MVKKKSIKLEIEALVEASVDRLVKSRDFNQYSFKMGECVDFAVALTVHTMHALYSESRRSWFAL